MRNSEALRPRWQVVAWGCAALALAAGLALLFFAELAPEVRHAQVSAAKPPAPASGPAAPAPEPPAPPAIASVPAPVPVAPPTAPRAKAFPAVVVDASAEILYNRLARSEVTLDQAGEVAKLHKALEPCWMASLYERMALLVPPDSDPKGHAMAQRLAREQRASARPGCGQLPVDVYTRADEWTARLAMQGDPQSMMDYGGAYWTRGLEHARTDPERLAEYRRTTLTYLNALIDQGYVDALISMASIRSNPTWGEPQPAEVWAYVYADAKAKGNVSSQANLLQSIDQRVPPEGRQRARDMAQELLGRCCGG